MAGKVGSVERLGHDGLVDDLRLLKELRAKAPNLDPAARLEDHKAVVELMRSARGSVDTHVPLSE